MEEWICPDLEDMADPAADTEMAPAVDLVAAEAPVALAEDAAPEAWAAIAAAPVWVVIAVVLGWAADICLLPDPLVSIGAWAAVCGIAGPMWADVVPDAAAAAVPRR